MKKKIKETCECPGKKNYQNYVKNNMKKKQKDHFAVVFTSK